MKNWIIPFLVVAFMAITGCDEPVTHAANPPAIPVGEFVVLPATQPQSYTFAYGGNVVPFTRITITSTTNLPIDGIVVELGGYVSPDAIQWVVLLDENDQAVGAPQVFDVLSRQATIGGTFLVPPGTSETYSVALVMASDLASFVGQVASVSVTSVNTPNISGTFPIYGAPLTLGDTSICSSTDISNGVVPGDHNQTLGTFPVTSVGTSYVGQMVFHFNVPQEYLATSLELYDENGVIVAGPVDAVPEGALQKVTFTDTVTYQDGTHTYSIKGRPSQQTPIGTVIEVSSDIATDWSNTMDYYGGPAVLALDSSAVTPSVVTQPVLIIDNAPTTLDSPLVVLGGSTNQTVNVARFTAVNGDIFIHEIHLLVSMGVSSITQISIWDGATQIGAMPVNTSNEEPVLLLSEPITIPKGTYKDLTINVDLWEIGVGLPGIEGAAVRVDATSTHMLPYAATTGAYVPACGNTATVGVQTVSAIPVP